jgi:hypothetical protein
MIKSLHLGLCLLYEIGSILFGSGAGDFNVERHSTAIKLSFRRKGKTLKNMSHFFTMGNKTSASKLITLIY